MTGAGGDALFQSLFWWNVLLNSPKSYRWLGVTKFQSLFWWNVLLKARMGNIVALHSKVSILVLVECTSESGGFFMYDGTIHLFQSLFWWNVLLNVCDAVVRVVCWKFQSLFWWNVLLKKSRWGVSPRKVGFNPCSGGMYF